jgi:hypothetical protein
MTERQNPSIPTVPADLQSLGSTAVTSANQLSAAGSSMSAQVQAARVSGLKRAAASAVATYGADSTEATAPNQAVTTAQAKTGRLQIVSQKAATTTPTVAATGWALHGRVYDANLNPQERYTVFLVDEQKNYLSDYGFSYTDSTGYFLLQYQGAPASGSSGASETGAATSASTGASGVAATAVAPRAYVQVYDAKAKPVLSSSTPFTPVTGQATYQVLTLPASGQSLGDPPAEIRAVAVPPSTSKSAKTTKTAKTNEESTTPGKS